MMKSVTSVNGRPRSLLSIALAAVVLSGCKMGPDYVRPEVKAPDAFRHGSGSADPASIVDQPWWEVFNDPTLVELVNEALRNNYDLRAAVTRIEQARGIRSQVRSGLFPQVGYAGDISRGRNEFLGSPSPNRDTNDAAFAGLTAFWELDVWGRVRRADEAAVARIVAVEEDRRAIMLSLVSDVAQLYFQLLGLDLQLEIAKRNTESFGASVDLFRQRAEGGVDSNLPLLRGVAAKAFAAATIPQVETSIAITEHALSVLVGRAPDAVTRLRPLADQTIPPQVPAGLPSQLLERRPDIRFREQRMIEANAEVGVALANYFPQIGLSSVLGRVSPELSAFSSGSNNMWSIAAGLSGPIFQGGRLKGQERAARARLEETIANYQQSVLAAMRDVSDALITRQKLDEIEVQQIAAVDSLVQAVTTSTDRFLGGLSGYFEVIEAQQELFPAEQALADTRTRKLLVLVQLYRALGGGWNLADDQWTSDSAVPPPEQIAPPD